MEEIQTKEFKVFIQEKEIKNRYEEIYSLNDDNIVNFKDLEGIYGKEQD